MLGSNLVGAGSVKSQPKAVASFIGQLPVATSKVAVTPLAMSHQPESKRMRGPSPERCFGSLARVQALHESGRLALAIIHGSPEQYFNCLKPAAVLESERLTSAKPPVPVKSTTLLPSPKVSNARVSLYTRVAGPWAQAGYGAGPEKKVFFAFDACTADSFTDGDAMTVYGCDSDGVVDYKAAQSHTQVLNSVTDLDNCMRSYSWPGHLNELLVRMNANSLVGMGVLEDAYGRAGSADYTQLGKMISSYSETTGGVLPFLSYDPTQNKLQSISPAELATKLDDAELQQQMTLLPMDKTHHYQNAWLNVKNALHQLTQHFDQHGLDLSKALLNEKGHVLQGAQWGQGAHRLNRAEIISQVLGALAGQGITPASPDFGPAYYRLMLQCHLAIRLAMGEQALVQASKLPTTNLPGSNGLFECSNNAAPPILLAPMLEDLALLNTLNNEEHIEICPRVLLRLLPEELRSVQLCRDALEKGAPLMMVPTQLPAKDYVHLLVPILNRFPQRFKELPRSLAHEHSQAYLDIIKKVDRLDAAVLDNSADCYFQALQLVLANNPKAIRDVRPNSKISIDDYKCMVSDAITADPEVFDRISWQVLASDEAFCLPLWRKAVEAHPEKIRQIPEGAKSAIIALARATIKKAPENIKFLWPQFWRPNVDRATFVDLLQFAQSLDSNLKDKLPGHLRTQFADQLSGGTQ